MILKDEIHKDQLYISLKHVHYWAVETLGFLLGLYPRIDIKFYTKKFTLLIKQITKLENPMYALVLKTVFDGRKNPPSNYSSRSFTPILSKPKAIYIEAKASQSLSITSAIRTIISSPGFCKIYNDNITFIPQFEYSQDDH